MNYILTLVLLALTACQTAQPKSNAAPTPEAEPVAVKAAAPVATESDDFVQLRQQMTAGEEPSRLRDRWSTKQRERRETFDRGLRRQRDEYNKRERTTRETFLKKLKSERDKFMKSADHAKKSKEFFEEQNAQRQDYFNDERDNRKEFESRTTEERKSFEAFMVERTNQFGSEIRDYTAKFNEMKKQKPAAPKPSAAPQPAPAPEVDDFKQIQKVPSTPLAPPSGD